MASRPRQRLPLGRTRRRLGYERRLRLTLALLGLPLFALSGVLAARAGFSVGTLAALECGLVAGWAVLQSAITDQLLRPLQTLSNVVGALREQDYSFRARGARRGDALGDLALEINALANDLQSERLASLESAALVRRVLDVLDAPVLAFDEKGVLRLLNPAASRILAAPPPGPLGRHAGALGIEHLLSAADEQVVALTLNPVPGAASGAHATQWVVRRSRFRERGAPHDLLLLADVSQALRKEEQEAWRRLIRVLGHEINNSLTPIKSLAGSLRYMLRTGAAPDEFDRPLEVIEQRAESLNRFLAAYRELAQLAPPRSEPLLLAPFLRQLVPLEVRVPVRLEDGPAVTLLADKDQLAQAVINLLRNGAEAALANEGVAPELSLSWSVEASFVTVRVHDSGQGIANPSNLFVPFYTTKQSGTGIGLFLVKQIVEAHGGSATLTNREGGTDAELRLPLATGSTGL